MFNPPSYELISLSRQLPKAELAENPHFTP
jgi:hypothetical protein